MLFVIRNFTSKVRSTTLNELWANISLLYSGNILLNIRFKMLNEDNESRRQSSCESDFKLEFAIMFDSI